VAVVVLFALVLKLGGGGGYGGAVLWCFVYY
jgi:hypothetical protein